jgi:hypothetical protein
MPAPKTKTPNIKQLTSDLSLLKKIAYRLWHYRQGTVITDAHKTWCEITQEVLALAGRLHTRFYTSYKPPLNDFLSVLRCFFDDIFQKSAS